MHKTPKISHNFYEEVTDGRLPSFLGIGVRSGRRLSYAFYKKRQGLKVTFDLDSLADVIIKQIYEDM